MNNNLIKEVVNKHCPSFKKCIIKNNSIIYNSLDDKMFVAKKENNNIKDLYNYLSSRGFNNIPKLVYSNNFGYSYEYEEETDIPSEQRINDLIKLDALLHSKTAYYKNISLDEVKEIYENLNYKIEDTINYYNNLLNYIENNIYMSPSYYLLARNSSMLFNCLDFSRKLLDNWYEVMKNKNKKRVVLLHNNLDINHIIRSKKDILLSWNYYTRDLPIYDFIKLFRNNYYNYNFIELYREYNNIFPFLEEEKLLLFIILYIPKKIEFIKTEFENTLEVSNLYNFLYSVDNLFMEQEAKNTNIKNNNINE